MGPGIRLRKSYESRMAGRAIAGCLAGGVRAGRPARERPAVHRRAEQVAWRRDVTGGPTAIPATSAGVEEAAEFGRLQRLLARPREPD